MENKKGEKILKTKKPAMSVKKTNIVSSKKNVVKKSALKTVKKVSIKEQSKVPAVNKANSRRKVTNLEIAKPNISKPKVKKILRGTVLLPQVNGSKCIRVKVLRYVPHPLYKKLIKKTKIYLVACEIDDTLNVGDEIAFIKTRPISKRISFKYIKNSGVK